MRFLILVCIILLGISQQTNCMLFGDFLQNVMEVYLPSHEGKTRFFFQTLSKLQHNIRQIKTKIEPIEKNIFIPFAFLPLFLYLKEQQDRQKTTQKVGFLNKFEKFIPKLSTITLVIKRAGAFAGVLFFCACLYSKQILYEYHARSIRNLLKKVEKGFESQHQIKQIQRAFTLGIPIDLPSVLFKAGYSSNFEICNTIIRMLIQQQEISKDMLNSKHIGKTILQLICKRHTGQELLSLAQFLIEHGADPTISSSSDIPIEIMVARLFEPGITDEIRNTYVHCAELFSSVSFNFSPNSPSPKKLWANFSNAFTSLLSEAIETGKYRPQFFQIATILLDTGADPNIFFESKLEETQFLKLLAKHSAQDPKFLSLKESLICKMLRTGADLKKAEFLKRLQKNELLEAIEQHTNPFQKHIENLLQYIQEESDFRAKILNFDQYDQETQNSLFQKLITEYHLPGVWLTRIIFQLSDEEKHNLINSEKLLCKFVHLCAQQLTTELSSGKSSNRTSLRKLYDLRCGIESCMSQSRPFSVKKIKQSIGKLLVLITESGCFQHPKLYEIVSPLLLPFIKLGGNLHHVNQVGYNVLHLFAHGFDNTLLENCLKTAFENNRQGLFHALTSQVKNKNFTSTQTPLECAVSFMRDENENAKTAAQILLRETKKYLNIFSHSPHVDLSGNLMKLNIEMKKLEQFCTILSLPSVIHGEKTQQSIDQV